MDIQILKPARKGIGLRDSSARFSLLPTFLLAYLLYSGVMTVHADGVDDLIARRMCERKITGLSLAVIEDGKISKVQCYGFTDQSGKSTVTPATLFQAGSISKPVAATAALHLVEQGRLSLDADVNTQLCTWKVPENGFTKEKPVTLRCILSHSAGLTVHGFPGYAVDSIVPSLVQVLDGAKPANSPAIRVDIVPGSKERYSGGGYTVMQQMMIDVTRQPFPKFMHDTVLKQFGMTNSTYEQPLSQELASKTATGYYDNGKAVQGRWHIYPEMAAAGLWTTAADLARFVIGIQKAATGESNPVISKDMARQMLTRQKDNAGLGVFLRGEGKGLLFFHSGRDEGFDAAIEAFANTGQGAVIMINANDDSGVCNEIIEAIAKEYHWQR
ncbi:MAG: serine hydrolase [Methylacidiphilales bacterium]|nr:serine hydrolase [Candidatus Methylacidiphilales bacterium]